MYLWQTRVHIQRTDRKYGNNWVVSVDRPNYYRSIGYSDFSSGYYDISSGSRTDNASPSSIYLYFCPLRI